MTPLKSVENKKEVGSSLTEKELGLAQLKRGFVGGDHISSLSQLQTVCTGHIKVRQGRGGSKRSSMVCGVFVREGMYNVCVEM